MRKKDFVLIGRILKILQKNLIETQSGMPLQYVREYEKACMSLQVVKGMMEKQREKEKGGV